MQIDVVENAKRNIILGIVNRIILLLLPFVERTIIHSILGSQYLGLGSLFTSLISVLSLTELGFASAMVYNMYKPVAEEDIQKINSLLNYYKKVYRVIGCTILSLGSILIPFLSSFIKGSYPKEINLITLYSLYLFNTSLSYFLYAYLNSILVVHQREDIRSTINSVVKITLTITQIISLTITKSYYCYVILMPVFTILNNIWLGLRVHYLFPQYKPEGHISNEDHKNIRKLVAGTFVQQACAITRNSLDSVCISAFLGLTMTAIYNNYYLILNGVTAFLAIFTAAFAGGVGNHVATRSVRDNFEEMKKLDFVYLWCSGWCTICMLCLYQPFMILWMGRDMLLSFSAVLLLCIYFYILKLGDIKSIYNSARGLWWEQRYRAIIETMLNLILNIILGKFLGVPGIILATIISLFLCNYVWSTRIIFDLYFSISRMKEYYKYQFKQSFLILIVAVVNYVICISIQVEEVLTQLIIRMVICFILPNLMFFLMYRRENSFSYLRKVLCKQEST